MKHRLFLYSALLLIPLSSGAAAPAPLNLSGAVTTLTRSPLDGDGTGAAASFEGPHGIATDGVKLYVTDSKNSAIRVIQ